MENIVNLRHRSGLATKNRNFGAMLSQNPAADPLAGNYTMVKVCDILSVYRGNIGGNCLYLQPLNVTIGKLTDRQSFDVATSSLVNGNIAGDYEDAAVFCDDFNLDGFDEIALLYADKNHNISLEILGYDKTANNTLKSYSKQSLGNSNGSKLTLTADFISSSNNAGDNKNIIAAWIDSESMLHVWIGEFSTNPVSPRKVIEQTLAKITSQNYQLATGVFSGTTNGEIAVVYQGDPALDTGRNLYLNSFTFTPSESSEKYALKSQLAQPLAIGTITYDTASLQMLRVYYSNAVINDGLITVFQQDGNYVLQSYGFNGDKWQMKDACQLKDESNIQSLKIAVGDLDLDGMEELVVACALTMPNTFSAVKLQTYEFNNGFEFVPKAADASGRTSLPAYIKGNASFDIASFGFNIGISLLQNTAPLIVIQTLGADHTIMPLTGYASLNTGCIGVTPDLGFSPYYTDETHPQALDGIFFSNSFYDISLQYKSGFALAFGDFSGNSAYLGAPEYNVLNDTGTPLAIINCLPNQGSVNPGTVTFRATGSDRGSLSLKIDKAHTQSDNLSENIAAFKGVIGLNHSLRSSYGERFALLDNRSASITEGIEASAGTDDAIILISNVFDVWEYPVYCNAVSTEPIGHLLLVFPQNNKYKINILSGSLPETMYKPGHICGVVSSYPSDPPGDYDANQASVCNIEIVYGDTTDRFEARWSDSNNNAVSSSSHSNQSKTNSQSLKVGFLNKKIGGGISHSKTSRYRSSRLSNYTITFNQNLSIVMSYGTKSTSPDKDFTVAPYIYWSTDGGYLVLDYTVSFLPTSVYQSLTESAYSFRYPDPGSTTSDKMKLYTTDIDFDENYDENTGDILSVNVYVTVRNNGAGNMTSQGMLLMYVDDPAGEPVGNIALDKLPGRSIKQYVFTAIKLPVSKERPYREVYVKVLHLDEPSTYNEILLQGMGLYPPQAIEVYGG
ncbi:MAG TPA: hypothetical protein VG738_19550 [Chitinophagaceae bacterium]|nr:hypothetical protein [Chitinophagaceae bacterium]